MNGHKKGFSSVKEGKLEKVNLYLGLKDLEIWRNFSSSGRVFHTAAVAKEKEKWPQLTVRYSTSHRLYSTHMFIMSWPGYDNATYLISLVEALLDDILTDVDELP